jgi:hypothetical protein
MDSFTHVVYLWTCLPLETLMITAYAGTYYTGFYGVYLVDQLVVNYC